MHTITFVFETSNRRVKREVELCNRQLLRANRNFMYDCMIATARDRAADAQHWVASEPGRSVSVYMKGRFKTVSLDLFVAVEMRKLIRHYNDMRNYVGD